MQKKIKIASIPWVHPFLDRQALMNEYGEDEGRE
jgi:hypothetical protein